MCSIGDDNLDDVENLKFLPPKLPLSPIDTCNKCRDVPPCVLLRGKDKYCKECFLVGTVHKFKALLGKCKLIRPKDRVLVVYKCGHHSTALLHFIHKGLNLETHKRFRFEPLIVFIEDHHHLSVEERLKVAKNVEDQVKGLQLPFYCISLSELIQNSDIATCLKPNCGLLELSQDDKVILQQFLQTWRSSTDKVDYLAINQRQFYVEIAKTLSCKFVFTPELSAELASQLLADISLGKGPHVTLDTGFCDDREEDVKILRPLRLHDSKELAFYNYFNNLSPVSVRRSHDKLPTSIQSVITKFVSDLQLNYPATVTTILKTGDKLTVDEKLKQKCELCHAPFCNEKISQLTSAESTEFSHWVSTHTPNYELSPERRYENVLATFTTAFDCKYCFNCRRLNKV